MMNSQEIYALVEQIASFPGKLDKLELVKLGMTHPEFVRVMEHAYNPFKVYGLKKRPETVELSGGGAGGYKQFDVGTWTLLGGLLSRAVSGHRAIALVQHEMAHLMPESAELLWRIITKDMRAGFSESTINKAKPKTIPTFPYQRCSLPKDSNFDKFDFGKGVISQEKADGMFANVNRDESGFIWITSRAGTPIPLDNLTGLEDAIARGFKPGTQTHGELLIFREGKALPREQGNGMLKSVVDGGSLDEGCVARFYAWDQIPLAAVIPKGKVAIPYSSRLQMLAVNLTYAYPDVSERFDAQVQLIPTRLVKSRDEAWSHYRELLLQGKEGTVISCPNAGWKDGTSKDKVKLKLKAPVELRIVGRIEGTGKNVGRLGSFIMESECGQLRVGVNGRDDAGRAEFWDHFEAKYMGAIACVEANSIMKPQTPGDLHSLFLPVLVEIRTDKDKANTLDEIFNEFQAAMEAA